MLLALSTIFLLSIINQSQSQFVSRGACPPAIPLTNVDISRMSGRWYAAKRIDNNLERNHICSQVVLTLNGNNTFTLAINGLIQPNAVEFSWRAVGVPMEELTYGAYRIVNSNYAAVESMDVIFLAADYDNYAVFTSCDTASGAYYQYAWILSRSTALTHVDEAVMVLKSNNIPADETVNVDHRNCPN